MSRSLYRAIEELERLQAARKARENSATSATAEPTPLPLRANHEQPEKQVFNNSLGESTSIDPEDEFGKKKVA